MKTQSDVAIAIPFFNERECAAQVLEGLISAFRRADISATFVAVNNGSTDGTAEIIDKVAEENREVVPLHLEENQGYSGGILAGLNKCEAPVVGYTWGDGQVNPDAHVEVYNKLVQDDLDLCKVRRTERNDGTERTVMTTIYNFLFSVMFRTACKDINGCPKLLKKDVFDSLDATSEGWLLDPDIMIKVSDRKLAVAEIPAVCKPRSTGKSKVNVLLGFQFLWAMIGYFFSGRGRKNVQAATTAQT